MEDIQNKAAYDVKNVGVSYTHSGSIGEKIDNYNKEGLTPNLSPGAKNDASSTTKSAISQGTITTTKEQIDITKINRDTQHALNELDKIFDKKKIEERQDNDVQMRLYTLDSALRLASSSFIHSGNDELQVAGIMLNNSLNENGKEMHYGENSQISQVITRDKNFKNAILEYGKKMREGEVANAYLSFRPSSYALVAAFGNLKMAVTLKKEENGKITVNGQIADLYDFSNNTQAYKSLSSTIFYLPNNMGILAENYGFIEPYVYTIDIQTSIHNE